MKHATIIIAISLVLAAALPTATANAQNARSFVSGQGSDSNSCTLAAPCRTFAFAITRTNAGGEILTLNPAGYGPVTIDKSISIVSSPGIGGVNILTTGTAITINAQATDVISLRGLTIDGLGIGTTGIVFNTGKSLTLDNCVIRHFTSSGIAFSPSASAKLMVSNTELSDNGGDGAYVQPTGTALATAVLDHVKANNNGQHGIAAFGNLSTGNVTIIVSDSIAAHNDISGFAVATNFGNGGVALTLYQSVSANNGNGLSADGDGANLYIGHSVMTGNGHGWVTSNTGDVVSYGDNYMFNNGANTGTLGTVPKQ